MHLLNVHTRQLREFVGTNIPPYAILSHTWGEDEVLFQDLSDPKHKEKLGYKKIEGCCRQALRDGHDYVWVDTCCIDKKSSAELSEAINSMFKWYQQASVCYAYLVDVPFGENPRKKDSAFRKSRWFTRGWTLQELVGPKKLIFFDTTWTMMQLHEYWFPFLLFEITGIRSCYIGGDPNLTLVPVAEKLSWVSNRHTTRMEDMAYCLLGLLDVNMPLLYGEGHKAFLRLQEEFLKKQHDPSILYWGLGMSHLEIKNITAGSPRSFLATTPQLFRGWGTADKIMDHHSENKASRLTWTVTPHGLHMELPILPVDTWNNVYIGILDSIIFYDNSEGYVAIPLQRDGYTGIYRRPLGCTPFFRKTSTKWFKPNGPKLKSIYLDREDEAGFGCPLSESLKIVVEIGELYQQGFVIDSLYPPIVSVDGNFLRAISQKARDISFVLVLYREQGLEQDTLYLRVTCSAHWQVEWVKAKRHRMLMACSPSHHQKRSAIEVWEAHRRA
ncbi:HET-domain-containing protein [Xylariaceae sp. AK1471]|nr:HET-domain-containing protein [Xylariaceae sp. AK1471]